MEQKEIEIKEQHFPMDKCERVKFVNAPGTKVICHGMVTWHPSIDPKLLFGICDKCQYKHIKKA